MSCKHSVVIKVYQVGERIGQGAIKKELVVRCQDCSETGEHLIEVANEIIDLTGDDIKPYKIWDILKEPIPNAIYKASNTIPTWEGVEIQADVRNGYATISFASVPNNNNSRKIKLGSAVPLLRAVTKADWHYIGEMKSLPFAPLLFEEFAREMMLLLSALQKDRQSKIIMTYFQEQQDSISNARIELERMRDEWIVKEDGEEKDVRLLQLKSLYVSIERLSSFIDLLDVNKVAQQCEIVLSLIYYLYENLWGEKYWNDNIHCHLTIEEMNEIASDFIEEVRRG